MSDRLPFSLVPPDNTDVQPTQSQWPLGLNDLMAAFRSQVGQQSGPTMADAAQWHGQNLSDTWQAIQNPQTWKDAARQYGQGLLFGTTAPGEGSILAYHGSPYSFDRFDASKIGTGEGAQAYGHGLYFAENEGVARGYRDALAKAQTPEETAAWYLHDAGGDRNAAIAQMTDHAVNGGIGATADEMANIRNGLQLLKSGADIKPAAPGSMYQVNIQANPEHFLDWDKPLSEQSQRVSDRIAGRTDWTTPDMTGARLYGELQRRTKGDPVAAAQQLSDMGIPGIRYLDAGSRGAGQGTSNYVVFDANTIDILRKYGIAGLIAGGGAAAGSRGQSQ